MRRTVIRYLRLGGGGLLVLAGVISGFVPVVQGWLLIIAGLTVMAPESRRARQLLDWAKSKIRPQPAEAGRGDGSAD